LGSFRFAASPSRRLAAELGSRRVGGSLKGEIYVILSRCQENPAEAIFICE